MNRLLRIVLTAVVVTMLALPALAQNAQAPSSERVTVAATFDVRTAYMFRGVRQDDTGAIFGPAADIGLLVHQADSGVTSARVHLGNWNSVHTGWAGSQGPSGKRWYESDLYATAALEFGRSFAIDTTFIAYRSPNDMFTAVKELSLKATTAHGAVQPYALVAFELAARRGTGQLDGGFKAGRYLELGATPHASVGRVAITAPVKVGVSLADYYELAGKDRRFGFASIAGIATLPIARWLDVHGGVEVQRLGEATKAFNGGEATKTIASVGIGMRR